MSFHSSLSSGSTYGSHRGSIAVGDHWRSNLGFISGLGVICSRGSWCYTPAVEYIFQVANRLTRLFLACELSIVRGNSKENIGVSQKATHILLNITEVSKCPAITVSKYLGNYEISLKYFHGPCLFCQIIEKI